MLGMPGPLGTIVDLLAVMLGFGAIVFIHELGHFIAARWAGIRVLTFAVGFGPALVSYRRGIGLRKGSTVNEYNLLVKQAEGARGDTRETARTKLAGRVSPTEYRISALPFGGYVQMLGQDDLDPTAVSKAKDSYQNAPVWKRMVVISAGVVMNIILAAVLFVIVFMAGLQVAPPIAGEITPDGPAAKAVYTGDDPTVTPGLRPGDRVVSFDGLEPNRFESLILKAAMAKQGRSLPITVERETPEGTRTLNFEITPEKGDYTGLLDLGILEPRSSEIVTPTPETQAAFTAILARSGLGEIQPEDRIVSADGTPISNYAEFRSVFENTDGTAKPITVERGNERITFQAYPQAAYELATAEFDSGPSFSYQHLLGMTPVLRVADSGDVKQGLQHGDIFKRIGNIEFPSEPAGIAEIRAHAGKPLTLEVIRADDQGNNTTVTIEAKVSADGRVGFTPSTTAENSSLLSMPPAVLVTAVEDSQPTEYLRTPPPAADWVSQAGVRVRLINGTQVADFASMRRAIREAAATAPPETPITLSIEYDAPVGLSPDAIQTAEWTITPTEAARVAALGWESPIPIALFAPTQTTLQAEGPIDAIGLGIDETKRVMASVYVTFLRLTQGSIAVENIKGPVGIAHIGTMVADRGVIWMLFFLGMISVNLAVVNFLPLPIVDGGQFLMLLYEGIRGKPVPVPVQSAIMTAGLLLIASVFLLVTFNDIKAILGV